MPTGQLRRGVAPPRPPHTSTDSRVTPGRLRWVFAGEVVEVRLAPGPQLVPVADGGERLVSTILAALDDGAAGETRVRRPAGELEVFLDVGHDWPRPARSPSWAIGGGDLLPDSEALVEARRRLREHLLRAGGLDQQTLQAMIDYPVRRRALAARRLRLDRRLIQLDDQIQAGRRAARIALAGAMVGVAGLVAGVVTSAPLLLIAAASLFCLGSGVMAERRLQFPAAEARRLHFERRLEVLIEESDALDDQGRSLARRLGCRDPWEAADRALEALASRRRLGGRERSARITEVAAEMARRLLRPAPPPDAPLPAPARGAGWPAEVAGAEGRVIDDALVLRAAALIERLERELPAPWPLVLWEPWPDLPAGERARALFALAETMPERAVIALVRGR
ncbi:MAG: hypothetical protein Q9Q40_00115 [Acidobacteriota bacterium]|nr:hypothetical protein [Acidobacteriota bacterium]MDQ7088409.1 hypothetical protein [Acidobacteriota bacterium]